MGLSFVNLAMLAGLAALAIPVLIHLLLKTRQRKLRFSTLRFFDILDEQSEKKRKIRHWLLLCLRLLILALLVFAFARPYLGGHSPASTRPKQLQAIFIIDRSASMLAKDREGQRWSRALSAMEKTIASLDHQTRVVLINCGHQADLLAGTASPADALKTLANLKPTEGVAQLRDGLRLAAKLAAGGSHYSNIIYIVTDLQRASCRDLQLQPLPENVAVVLLNFGDRQAPNLAITDIQLSHSAAKSSYVTVANFADEFSEPANLRVYIDGRQTHSVEIQPGAGEVKQVNFLLPGLAHGWHDVEARLEAADALTTDNRRWQTLFVPPPISVLVVEPRQGVKIFQEESFFVMAALDPAFGLSNAPLADFLLEKTAPENLVSKIALTGGKPAYEAVLLPGLKRLPAGAPAALLAHVQAGGGLMIFINDAVSANHYNLELSQLLPAPLGTVETADDLDWRIWEWERKSPVFAPFNAPNSGNISLSRFTRRFSIPTSGAGVVLARFQDGMPALLERTIGKGRVLLFNSTSDTSWNDWPKHKTFVPWLHSAVRYLARRHEQLPNNAVTSIETGREMEISLGAEFHNQRLRLISPDGKQKELQADSHGLATGLEPVTPGIYSLRTPDGREIQRLAANFPLSESDLTAFTPAEFQRQIARTNSTSSAAQAGLFTDINDGRREIWRTLLLGGLLLMLVETIFGNRTAP